MSKLDYGLEKGGSPDPTGYGEEDVRALAEERARKRIANATDLYEMVEKYEFDIWPLLAYAIELATRPSNNDTFCCLATMGLRAIHAMVLPKATELEMPAARRELAMVERQRMGKTRYCGEDE